MFLKLFANMCDFFFIEKMILISPQILKAKLKRLFVSRLQNTTYVFIFVMVQPWWKKNKQT